ncbi:hypothetical protein [Catenuloplanes atrovinosus]|uniref:DUF5666 domain-containing protein n=1 Tax=Catenuloplanes atrovinosus TaxID=137266 RepID=A0AAE3YV61_9ACTN|nr:hypothetical protein [Catenuloplanes atrovinosus]MDR7279772.1 hypothetical protein [Catenuloplanes atrovinosus]
MAFRRSKHRGTADSGDTAVLPGARDHDGLAAQLAATAPRQWWNRWTPCLAAVLLLGGGVLAGVQIQQRWGTTTTSGPGGGGAAGAAGFQGGGFPGRQPAATESAQPTGGGTTEGTVKLVNGSTVYIVTGDGRTVTVKTSDGTAVRVAADGALTDLAEGDTVTVEGTAGSDDSVTATTITEK